MDYLFSIFFKNKALGHDMVIGHETAPENKHYCNKKGQMNNLIQTLNANKN
jgi:hypothetical protein